MSERRRHGHGDVKRSRFITGAAMLGGLLILGLGIGLAAGQPGFGVVIAVGTWLVAGSVIRTMRDMRRVDSIDEVHSDPA